MYFLGEFEFYLSSLSFYMIGKFEDNCIFCMVDKGLFEEPSSDAVVLLVDVIWLALLVSDMAFSFVLFLLVPVRFRFFNLSSKVISLDGSAVSEC